ncbi:hypothetical protein [Aurantiacibacter spongiae]|uniref:Secreted protein n=1 Tax=Aurantiacibacter spongiae TaxID=2488860 RepID=A0A3N5DFF7_9SPHN|nr:hypothetical protein [Aurantiacibacter spongiae]RPF70382.1 hypothetical protein EG799_01100 [Aurantiacibacter spongiae]
MSGPLRLVTILAFSAATLAACNDGADPEQGLAIADEAREEAPDETGVAVDNIASERVEGIDDPIPALEELGDPDDLDLGEMVGACSFASNDKVLFIAGSEGSDRARGRGVIQIAGRDRVLAGADMTGPEGIMDGPTMTDGEYTVTIDRGSGDGERVGAESTRWPAELVVSKDARSDVRYAPGTWTCGV